jgi:NADP-dependent 3-hydroxy acid dehydrogenase YdfG
MHKIALITGATAGIGKACAEKFAAGGYHLILTGRREERLQALKQQLESATIEVITLCFDVQVRSEVFNAIEQLPEKWKNIDLLINNAGLALGRDSFENADIDDWDTMMHTNVDGLLYVSRAILPYMLHNRNGHIINIGSIAGKEFTKTGMWTVPANLQLMPFQKQCG